MFTRSSLTEALLADLLTGEHFDNRTLRADARLQLEQMGVAYRIYRNYSAFVTESKVVFTNGRESVTFFSVSSCPTAVDIHRMMTKLCPAAWRVMP